MDVRDKSATASASAPSPLKGSTKKHINTLDDSGTSAHTVTSAPSTSSSLKKKSLSRGGRKSSFDRLHSTVTSASKHGEWKVHKRTLEERKKKIKSDPKDDNVFLAYGKAVISQSPPHKQCSPTSPREIPSKSFKFKPRRATFLAPTPPPKKSHWRAVGSNEGGNKTISSYSSEQNISLPKNPLKTPTLVTPPRISSKTSATRTSPSSTPRNRKSPTIPRSPFTSRKSVERIPPVTKKRSDEKVGKDVGKVKTKPKNQRKVSSSSREKKELTPSEEKISHRKDSSKEDMGKVQTKPNSLSTGELNLTNNADQGKKIPPSSEEKKELTPSEEKISLKKDSCKEDTGKIEIEPNSLSTSKLNLTNNADQGKKILSTSEERKESEAKEDSSLGHMGKFEAEPNSLSMSQLNITNNADQGKKILPSSEERIESETKEDSSKGDMGKFEKRPSFISISELNPDEEKQVHSGEILIIGEEVPSKKKTSSKGKMKGRSKSLPEKLTWSLIRKLDKRRRKNAALECLNEDSNGDDENPKVYNNTWSRLPKTEEKDDIDPESEYSCHRRGLQRRKSLFKPKTWRKSFYNNQFITKLSKEQKSLSKKDSAT